METDPVVYPKIKIEGKEVEVKFRCSDAIKIFKQNTARKSQAIEINGVEAVFEQLSAGIAHAGVEKTAEQLATLFDFAEFGIVSAAVDEAMSLAMAQIKKSNPKLAALMEANTVQLKEPATPKTAIN